MRSRAGSCLLKAPPPHRKVQSGPDEDIKYTIEAAAEEARLGKEIDRWNIRAREGGMASDRFGVINLFKDQLRSVSDMAI